MQEVLLVDEIAAVCHNVNKAYCESIGDFSQNTWNDSPEWQKKSAIEGVQFRIDNPLVTPMSMHENWRKAKEADGWRYGEVKDPEKKEHPCMVPYGELPKEQKSKDFIFSAIVDQLKPVIA